MARVLQRAPGDLQEQSVLRIHRGGLARGDPEEGRVESVHAVDEGAPSRVRLPGRVRVRVVERIDVPPVAGHLADHIHSVVEQPPELVRRLRTREPHAHPDDRDGLVTRALGRFETPLERFDRIQRALQERTLIRGRGLGHRVRYPAVRRVFRLRRARSGVPGRSRMSIGGRSSTPGLDVLELAEEHLGEFVLREVVGRSSAVAVRLGVMCPAVGRRIRTRR